MATAGYDGEGIELFVGGLALLVLGAVTLATGAGGWKRWSGNAPAKRFAVLVPAAMLLVAGGLLAEVPLRHPLPAEELQAQTQILDEAAAALAAQPHDFKVVTTFENPERGSRVFQRAEGTFDPLTKTSTWEMWEAGAEKPEKPEAAELDPVVGGARREDPSVYEPKTTRHQVPDPDGEGWEKDTWAAGVGLFFGAAHHDVPRTFARLSSEWEELGTKTVGGETLTGWGAEVDPDLRAHQTYLLGLAVDEELGNTHSYREKQWVSPHWYQEDGEESTLREEMEVWLRPDGSLAEASWTTRVKDLEGHARTTYSYTPTR